MSARLSVVIPTQDSEETIGRVLASVSFADEILVFDSGSRDRTVELARAAGAVVVERAYRSDGDQRAAGWTQATGIWVLGLDSDEVLDPVLAQAIGGVVARDPAPGEPVAYHLRFRNYFLGHPLDHGGLDRDLHERLGLRARTRWPSMLHSVMEVDGPVGELPGVVHHYTATSLESRLRKIAAYAADRAARWRAAGVKPSVSRALGQAGRLFFGRVFVRGGWKDGLAGVVWWWLQATEILLAHFLLASKPGEREGEGA